MISQLFHPDGRLVRKTLQGRRDAYGLLVARHMEAARAVARAHMRVTADAEDAVQEAFISAFQSLPELRDPSRFGPWLMTIVRRAAQEMSRRGVRQREVEDSAARETPDAIAPREESEMDELLQAQLERLPADQREVLMLRYFSGKSVRQVADVLGITHDAAAKRLQRAREALGESVVTALARDRAKEQAARQESRVRAVMSLIAPLPAAWMKGASASPAAASVFTVKAVAAAVVLPAAVAAAGVAAVNWYDRAPVPAPEQVVVANAVTQPVPVGEPAPAPAAESVRPAPLDVRLFGTISGAAPSAILSVDGGPQRSYVPGDAVAPGVILAEVGLRQITLEVNGEAVTVAQQAPAETPAMPDLSGIYEVTYKANGEPSREMLKAEHQGRRLFYTLESNPDEVLEASVDGRKITAVITDVIVPAGGRVGEVTLAGEFNEDWTVASLEANYDSNQSLSDFVLRRISQEELLKQSDDRLAKEERMKDMQNLARMLERYGAAHKGALPASLEELHQVALTDDGRALLAAQEGRTYRYRGGRLFTPFDDCDPVKLSDIDEQLPEPDRLMAWEKALEDCGKRDMLFPKPILEAEYAEPPCTFEIRARHTHYAMAGAEYCPLEVVEARDPAANESVLRAQCQNNLKQLALVAYMFANEAKGEYTPPGWLSTYPEYMTDTSILTCPRDEVQGESYVYVLPATNLKEWAKQVSGATAEDHELIQGTLAGMPMVIEATVHEGGGRNVAFADGHVEYVRPESEDWDLVQSCLNQ